MTIATECPECEGGGLVLDYHGSYPIDEACPDCDDGLVPVECAFCFAADADRISQDEPSCAACEVLTVCPCGEIHHREEWCDLRLVGVQEGAPYAIELRDCCCHSTLAVEEWRVHDSRAKRIAERREVARDRVHDREVPAGDAAFFMAGWARAV